MKLRGSTAQQDVLLIKKRSFLSPEAVSILVYLRNWMKNGHFRVSN